MCELSKCKNCFLNKANCKNNEKTILKNRYRLVSGVSDISGWGLFTLEDIPEGEFIREYIGEYLTNEDEIDKRGKINKVSQLTYMFGLADPVTLDSMLMGNKTRFINHSTAGNINIKVRFCIFVYFIHFENI